MDMNVKNAYRRWFQIIMGCLLTAAGLIILKHAHIVTGGTAGLALSLSYWLPIKFQPLFFLVNLPFFVFSYIKIGRTFTLRTAAAISLLTAFSSLDNVLADLAIPALLGSVVGGTIVGIGICSLFKNGASLGGSSILAIYLQRRYQFDPGKTILALDAMVLLTGFSTLSLSSGLISTVSIIVTSGIVSFYKGKNANAKRVKPENKSIASAV